VFKLTDEIWDTLWTEAELKGQVGWEDTETDVIDWATFPHVGRFYSCFCDLHNGLSLTVQKYDVLEDLHLVGPESDATFEVGMNFHLSGKVQTQLHGLTDEYEEPIGHYSLYTCAGLAETEQWLAVQSFYRVYVRFDPLHLFGDLSLSQQAQLPIEVQQVLQGHPRPFVLMRAITPEIHQVLHQVLHCPYAGLFKRLYLQGKVRELIMLALQPFQLQGTLLPSPLRAEEIEQVYHAKNLFVAQLDNPPSLAELAQQVGLNEFSLGQKFKQVFNTTLCRYLHEHRLEVARQLLVADRSLRIEEVSRQVGFANRGYFAAAFRKKFGANPKDYRKQQRC
jgi:AraC family transcriptional regulator, transcriptional activator of the genes for pyochelin and ferripyochelin receptors